jgi:hypothetical protein
VSRRVARFTEAELRRAIKAAGAANTRVIVEIPVTGPIRVIADPSPGVAGNGPKRRIAL